MERSIESRARWSAAASVTAAVGPPALVTLWAVLVAVLMTKPVRPYANGGLLVEDLAAAIVIGAVAAMTSTAAPALVGIVLGGVAAVAIQLYVLAGQAWFNPEVVAHLPEPPWATQVSIGLLVGFGGLAIGWLISGGVRRLLAARRAVRPTDAGQPTWRPVAAVAVVAGVVASWLLVAEAGESQYVVPAGAPTMEVTIEGTRITELAPTSVPAGRVRLIVSRHDGPTEAQLGLTLPLEREDQAAVTAGTVRGELVLFPGEFFPDSGGARQDTRLDMSEPGVRALVLVSYASLLDPDGAAVTTLDARLFEVTGPGPGAAPAETSSAVVVGASAAVLIEALAAAGTVLRARRRRWSAIGRPHRSDVTPALVVAVVTGGLLWLLIWFAISQSHSPF